MGTTGGFTSLLPATPATKMFGTSTPSHGQSGPCASAGRRRPNGSCIGNRCGAG